jgi:parvulin-like peptidyl-prolyl isomerase
MKRVFLLVLSVVFFLSSCSFPGKDDIAVINGNKVHKNELYMYFPDNNIDAMSHEEKERHVRILSDDYLTRYYLEEQGVLDYGEPAWEVSVWEIRELANRAYQSLIIDQILTEKALRGLYDQQKYEINISHILIGYYGDHKTNERSYEEAKILAEDVRAKTDSESFYEMVEQYSDDASKLNNKGNLGWGSTGRWLGPFEEVAFSLKPGEISNPVKTIYGFHIIKMNERREIPLPDFELMRNDLVNLAYTKWSLRFMEREKAVFDSLILSNPVVLNDSLLTDFIDRYTRLSRNVFYSEQFTSFDILDVFDDSLLVGQIGEYPVNKEWIYQYLKVINLHTPPRFADKRSFNSFIQQNYLGFLLYMYALDHNLDKVPSYQQVRNVYLAKKSASLFDKLYVYNLIDPDEKSLASFYEEQKDILYSNDATVQVREILLDDSLFAVKLLQRIRSGEDMAALATEHSIRNIGKANAGLIPPVKKSQYGEMGIAAFNMRDGEFGGPYKIGPHYSIIQRQHYNPKSYKSKQQVNYRLLTDFRNHYMPEKRDAQKEMLRKKYSVRINRSFLK